jgi:hypothetical protein
MTDRLIALIERPASGTAAVRSIASRFALYVVARRNEPVSAIRLLSLALLTFGISLAGCAGTGERNASSLRATPATSSLVVVECEAVTRVLFNIVRRKEVRGGMLLSADGFTRVEGRAVSNLIVFSDVPPGEYSLARIDTTWQPAPLCSGHPIKCSPGKVFSHRYEIPADQLRRFAVNARLGEPKFLGAIVLEGDHVPADQLTSITEEGVKMAFSTSNEAEVRAWKQFVQIYDGHPWAVEAQKRLTKLRQ